MWAGLSLFFTLCLLHGGGAESDGGGVSCQPPPAWKIGEVDPMTGAMGRVTVVALFQASWLFCLVQAGRMNGLRQKLDNQGLKDVVYMVVNHQGEQAQRLHTMLAQHLKENITLYKQEPQQTDVWTTLNGEKDDFFIYDRCGRLTNHISLPYSIIGQGHVESSIKNTYCKRICGECSHESAEIPEECKEKADAPPDTDVTPPTEEHAGHGHHHGQHHGRHGDNQDFHPRASGHRHHGQHHSRDHQSHQGQDQLDLGQVQQVVQMHQMPQEVQAVPGSSWTQERSKWKSKHSWQWTAGSDNEAAPKSSWCWHWRRLFGDAGSEEPVGLWHCDEALPASWQWQGLTGGVVNQVKETWQWRSPPADWPQQPQPATWVWPPGGNWEWGQL